MYGNLKEYIAALDAAGELQRINVRVNTELEIAEITDRVSKSPGGGKALLFSNTGTDYPVITNMFGSERRICLALGVDSLDELPARIENLFRQAMSPMPRLADKMRMIPVARDVLRWMPKRTNRRGECQQVIVTEDGVDLGELPILKCWPHDGGRFVTLPLVHTQDPETGIRNVGMYRMQVFSKNTTGMHWHMHKTGAKHYEAYKRRGERMPVSVCLGGDPVYTYSATAPMPDGMDEYLLAGFLRGRAVKLVKCITNDIYVPSDADFVIEGYVDTSEAKTVEGPFGDHTGFYSLEDLYPVFHVTAITRRRDAVYPATLVGIPPQEDYYIAQATEKIFLAPIRMALQPEIEDLWMPCEGVAHNLAVVNMRKSYAGQAMKVASGMWGAGQMMFDKFMVVASVEGSVRDTSLIARLLKRADIKRDVMFSRGTLDVLDHATATMGEGGKMMIDLTTDRPARETAIPSTLTLPEGASADLTLAGEWGLIILRGISAADFLSANAVSGINYIVEADAATETLSYPDLLWYGLANTEACRDIRVRDGVMIIDARSKTPPKEDYPVRWPNAVVSDRATIELVDRRWSEYGFAEQIESPSLKYARLLHSDNAEA